MQAVRSAVSAKQSLMRTYRDGPIHLYGGSAGEAVVSVLGLPDTCVCVLIHDCTGS